MYYNIYTYIYWCTGANSWEGMCSYWQSLYLRDRGNSRFYRHDHRFDCHSNDFPNSNNIYTYVCT